MIFIYLYYGNINAFYYSKFKIIKKYKPNLTVFIRPSQITIHDVMGYSILLELEVLSNHFLFYF